MNHRHRRSASRDDGAGRRKLTKRAQHAMERAADEAHAFQHDYLGTEHILLGLLEEGDGVAAEVLQRLGLSLDDARGAIEHMVGHGEAGPDSEVPLTDRATRVLEWARDEAKRMGHRFVGTEHLLLGLLAESGVGANVLLWRGITLEDARLAVLQTLAGGAREERGRGNVITCRIGDADLDAIDVLVEAGIRSTRSDAAAWLIHAGLESNQEMIEKVRGAVSEIRRLREEVARGLA